MRLAAVFLLLLVAACFCNAASAAGYDLYFNDDGTTACDASIHLDWPFTEYNWWIPPDMTVTGVWDAYGPLDFWTADGKVYFTSTSREPNQEIRIGFENANTSDCYGPVCITAEGFSGFVGATTQARLHFEKSEFFASEPEAENGVLSGDNGLFARVSYILPDKQGYRQGGFVHYLLYEPPGEDYSEAFGKAETLYPLVGTLTGLKPICRRFLVAMVPDGTLGPNFAGDYDGACSIRIKRSFANSSQPATLASTMIHETTHGFMMSLPGQNASWFKEGTAGFVDHRAYDEAIGLPPGDAWIIRMNTYNGSTYPLVYSTRRILITDLENFYENGGRWTPQWTPYDEQTPEEGNFGYAYSQFIISAYAKKYGDAAFANAIALLSRAGTPGNASPEDTRLILDSLRAASGTQVSDEELLYPYKSVLLTQGFAAFKEAVGNLSIDQAEINEVQRNALEAYYHSEVPAVGPQHYNATETGSGFEPNSFDLTFLLIVIILAVIVPLALLIGLVYLAYRFIKNRSGGGKPPAQPVEKNAPAKPRKRKG